MMEHNKSKTFQNNNPSNPFNFPATSFANPSINPAGAGSSSSLFAPNSALSNLNLFGSSTGNPFMNSKQQNTTHQTTNPLNNIPANSQAFPLVRNTNKQQTSTKQMPTLNLSEKNEETKKQGNNPFVTSSSFAVHSNTIQSVPPEPAKKGLTDIFGSSGTPQGNFFTVSQNIINPQQNQGLFGSNEASQKSSVRSLQKRQSDKQKQRVRLTNPLKKENTEANTRPNPNTGFLNSTVIPGFMITTTTTPRDQPLRKQQRQDHTMQALQQKTQKSPWTFSAQIQSTSMAQTQKKDNFSNLFQRPTNPPTLDQPTLKKDQKQNTNTNTNTNQILKWNPQKNVNEVVQQSQETQLLFAQLRDKNKKMYQQIMEDILNGRQMTSKSQMKSILEEEKRNVKQKLVNKLKDNKKPVNFNNHNVVYDALWDKRIGQEEQHIRMLQGYKAVLQKQLKILDDQLIIEQQQKQKYKGIMQITNPNLPALPEKASLSLKQYNEQMQLYKQQSAILEEEKKIAKLREEKANKQKQKQALQKGVEHIQDQINKQQIIYKGLDHQIIDIFHNQQQFKEYFDNQLAAKRNELMNKYQDLKMQIKSTKQKNRSKF